MQAVVEHMTSQTPLVPKHKCYYHIDVTFLSASSKKPNLGLLDGFWLRFGSSNLALGGLGGACLRHGFRLRSAQFDFSLGFGHGEFCLGLSHGSFRLSHGWFRLGLGDSRLRGGVLLARGAGQFLPRRLLCVAHALPLGSSCVDTDNTTRTLTLYSAKAIIVPHRII